MRKELSWGARALWQILRRARALPRGRRSMSLRRAASILGVSRRQVSRYNAELARKGIVHIQPPRKERDREGQWRSVGFNTYTFLVTRPPFAQTPRSHREDTSSATPTPWVGGRAPKGPHGPVSYPFINPGEALAAFLATRQTGFAT